MNKISSRAMTIGVCVVVMALAGCTETDVLRPFPIHPDGVYRGIYADEDTIQVSVEFRLENETVTEASFRHLRRDDDYHLETEEEPYRSVIQQYQEAPDYLIGKDIEAYIGDLYAPEMIVTKEVDGYTAATLRTTKIRSAIRDALNRGPYSF